MSIIWNTCALCGTLIHREIENVWLDQYRSGDGQTPVLHEHDPIGPWRDVNNDDRLEIDKSHDRHDGRKEFLAVIDNVAGDTGYGDGTGTYDTRNVMAEGYMIAGNGPTAWAWFVLRSDWEDPYDEIDHAYLTVSGGTGPEQLVPIPPHLAGKALAMLRLDSAHRLTRR